MLGGGAVAFLALISETWWIFLLAVPVAVVGFAVNRRNLQTFRELPPFTVTTEGVVVGGQFRPYRSVSLARLSNIMLVPFSAFAGFDWYLELEWPDRTSVIVCRGCVRKHEQVIDAVLRSLPQPLLEGMNPRRVQVAFPRTQL